MEPFPTTGQLEDDESTPLPRFVDKWTDPRLLLMNKEAFNEEETT